MKCISNIDRITYPSDLVMELTKLYRFKGKDFYYEDALKTRLGSIIKLTIEKDTFFAAKLLNLNITENRVRLIIRKDAKPKTKDEQILANLKEVFTLIQEKGTDIELTTNEFLHLAKKIYNNVKEIGFDYYIKKERFYLIEEKKRISKRDEFEVILNKYRKEIYIMSSFETLLFNAIKNGQIPPKSTYDIWLEAGFTGTPRDFLDSLKGTAAEVVSGVVIKPEDWVAYDGIYKATILNEEITLKDNAGYPYN